MRWSWELVCRVRKLLPSAQVVGRMYCCSCPAILSRRCVSVILETISPCTARGVALFLADFCRYCDGEPCASILQSICSTCVLSVLMLTSRRTMRPSQFILLHDNRSVLVIADPHDIAYLQAIFEHLTYPEKQRVACLRDLNARQISPYSSLVTTDLYILNLTESRTR